MDYGKKKKYMNSTIIIFASFISSFISSIVGFGGGMLLLGILALNFPVSKVIPLHAVIQLGSNLNRLFFFRFKVKWNIFLPFALGCIIGIPIGGIFFYSVNEDFLKILVAFFIIFSNNKYVINVMRVTIDN